MTEPATVTVTVDGRAASALLLMRADLTMGTGRDEHATGNVVTISGAAVSWTGRLTYLCDTFAQAKNLCERYVTTSSAQPATITGYDAGINGWPHILSGDPQIVRDQSLHGVQAPYLVQLPVLFMLGIGGAI